MKDSVERQIRYHRLTENYFWLWGHYDLACRLRKRFARRRDGLALDVGCGPANLHDPRYSFMTIGIDRSLLSCSMAAQKNSTLRYTCSDAVHLPFAQDSFQIIFAMEIIEHIENDSHVLNEIHRVLAKNGTAIISVPAFRALWGYNDELYGHFRRYSRQNLLQKLELSGFRVLYSTYYKVPWIIPLFIIRKIKMAFFHHKKTDDFVALPGWLNKLVKVELLLESRLVSRFPCNFFGCSLFAVITK